MAKTNIAARFGMAAFAVGLSLAGPQAVATADRPDSAAEDSTGSEATGSRTGRSASRTAGAVRTRTPRAAASRGAGAPRSAASTGPVSGPNKVPVFGGTDLDSPTLPRRSVARSERPALPDPTTGAVDTHVSAVVAPAAVTVETPNPVPAPAATTTVRTESPQALRSTPAGLLDTVSRLLSNLLPNSTGELLSGAMLLARRTPVPAVPVASATTTALAAGGDGAGVRPAAVVAGSSANLSQGVLTIRAGLATNIELRVSGQISQLSALDGATKQVLGTWLLGSVNRVEYIGSAGNDTFNGSAVSKPMTITGNGGNDTLTGGSDRDTINGNAGLDVIRGGAGIDTINGGTEADTIYGGADADTINGEGGNDTIDGEGGNDTVYGGADNDTLSGGNDNDTINGDAGDDTVNGGAGNDIINANGVNVAGLGNDVLRGDAGNDTIKGGDGNDTVNGGDGDDTISGDANNDFLYGDAGTDRITDISGDDTLAGGDGNDWLEDWGVGRNILLGGRGLDTLLGSDGNDTIRGNEDDDNIVAGGGNDTVYGDAGVDTIHGGVGDDTVYGGDGNDVLYGDANNDTIYGEAGNDTIDGGADNDFLYGGAGDDNVSGGTGDDTVNGDADNDRLQGGDGSDTMNGGTGVDFLLGGAGADTVRGDAGNDTVNGGTGMDSIYGGDGDDWLVGIDNAGFDFLYGDAGRDSFWRDLGVGNGDPDYLSQYVAAEDVDNAVAQFANGADRTLDGDRIAGPADPSGSPVVDFSGNPLFSTAGPRGSEVVQGPAFLGNFPKKDYTAVGAQLAALARDGDPANSWLIRRAMVDFGDGTYGVKLGGSFYRVDGRMPATNPFGVSSPYYANFGAGNSIWVAIAEKALATKLPTSSYTALKHQQAGGQMSETYVFNQFGDNLPTSTTGINVRLDANPAPGLTDALNRFRNGQTYLDVSLADSADGTLGRKFITFLGTSPNDASTRIPMVYTVWAVETVNNQVTAVILRNPWGSDTGGLGSPVSYADANSRDGLIRMTIAELGSSYRGGTLSELPR